MNFPNISVITEQKTPAMIDGILSRRSVRSFLSRKIDKETIDLLLQCAVSAPTAMHEEPCEFVVIQDSERLKEISDIARPLFIQLLHAAGHNGGRSAHNFTDPDFDLFYGAGALVVICSSQTGRFVDADCWLAAENLMLAAGSMGLGSCVIGSVVDALNLPDIKASLGITEQVRAIAPIIIGFPNDSAPKSTRHEPKILGWV